MSILVGKDTKLVVAGLTGREGSFHGGNNKKYGTNLVAGVTPGKGGQDADGTPVFDTMHAAVEETGACALGMFADNDTARRVYERLGFTTGMRWTSRWFG